MFHPTKSNFEKKKANQLEQPLQLTFRWNDRRRKFNETLKKNGEMTIKQKLNNEINSDSSAAFQYKNKTVTKSLKNEAK